MTRVAFTLIGGQNWTGGHNYLLNLLRALAEHEQPTITPVLFLATDANEEADAFASIPGIEIVASDLLNGRRRQRLLMQALLWGRVAALSRLFAQYRIGVVFEAAQFFGWRLGIPAIAWIPDFQHKALPQLFSKTAWWKREIGFRAQIVGGRHIMLSSADARRACEHYYPATVGRTSTVQFAVPGGDLPDLATARTIADSYGLPQDFIFMPNQFWRHKNHMRVLEALAILRERGASVVVAASGKQHDPRAPDYFSSFNQVLQARGLEASMRLLGLIPYEHLTALMLCCQALLNPSLFEGWSTTVEEARAMATPMVLSDLEVHREQMGGAARYFRSDSSLALADALQSVPCFDAAARVTAIRTARFEADARVRVFARAFSGLARGVAARGE
ncbi:MAG: glycosyltransferase family 4 protein [Betaproteobacteria bacterium]|nr:glycosyltransferase family 4 protein [Betaproteobacteria bacterium]